MPFRTRRSWLAMIVALAAGLLAAAAVLWAAEAGKDPTPPAAKPSSPAAEKAPAPPSGPSAATKEFEKLYKQYSVRFWELVSAPKSDIKTPDDVIILAAKTWQEVFGPHKDVVSAHVKEMLAGLDKAAPIREVDYDTIATFKGLEKAEGFVPKQWLWNPMSTASFYLNNIMLQRLLMPQLQQSRNILLQQATLSWEAIDTNIDKPRLFLRLGNWVFTADLVRKDDYYDVAELKFLAPKGSFKVIGVGGPAPVTTGAPTGTPSATETGGTVTPTSTSGKD
jgi:hypothetical protein